MDKVDFIVINENTLCYTIPTTNMAGILRASVIRGSTYNEMTGSIVIPSKGVRPATRNDFKDYMINPDGYIEDTKHYNFPVT